MKSVRGTEARAIAKWQSQGWELVSQDTATLRTTLTFRQPVRSAPRRQTVIGVAALAVLLGLLGVGAALEHDDPKDTGSTKPAPIVKTTPQVTATPTLDPTPKPTLEARQTAPSGYPSQPAEAADGPLTAITVDALLDKLNLGSRGGIKVGDRFRITGELMERRLWGVGATGEYWVLLKAQGGKQDLPVFVDRELTTNWRDGTRVQMIVKAVERTIQGETTDGWLVVQSARTL